ncbi:MAG: hydantoinase/oxoprolinase family protein [Gammaproteobacteria bacterium]|nr:hydantoinase/oxoprolinase family protein [Gammaproteobacteria bacterium]
MWSSRNPQHEQAAVEVLEEHFPSLPVFSGISLLPVLREYERSSAAALNAYCADAIDGVSELEAQLKALGMQVPLLLMHTTGGAVTVNDARRNPLGLASSGPAAGSAAAGSLCESLGIDQALTVDMGGTSIDIAVIENGQPMTRQRGEINGIFTAQPSVDVESIGAGGGSIAWVDARGALRVGPQSARANPGPVCFGRGGTEPTVTDALLVLGYIDGSLFLGGSVALDLDAATQACEKLGERIGLDAFQTAEGIRQIALAEMSRVVRSRLAQGGIKPSETAVVSYGGCGSLFAPALAADLGMGRVVVPPMTSVFSAFGAAVADLRRERVSLVDRMLPLQEESEVERVVAQIANLMEEVRGDLSDDGVEASKQSVSVYGDFRFYRQKWELTLPLEVDEANVSFDSQWAVAAFKKAYAQRYSEAALAAGAPVEFVSLRAIGIGETVRVELEELGAGSSEEPEPLSSRTLYQEGVGRQAVNAYQYESLRPGAQITGPALIDAVDTTIWVPGDSAAAFEASGSLVIAAKSANVISEAA